jgi:hypothetical protein
MRNTNEEEKADAAVKAKDPSLVNAIEVSPLMPSTTMSDQTIRQIVEQTSIEEVVLQRRQREDQNTQQKVCANSRTVSSTVPFVNNIIITSTTKTTINSIRQLLNCQHQTPIKIYTRQVSQLAPVMVSYPVFSNGKVEQRFFPVGISLPKHGKPITLSDAVA